MFNVDGHRTTSVQKSDILAPSKGDIAAQYACIANPCMNGAVCKPESTVERGYKCECTEKYTGILCEGKKGISFPLLAMTEALRKTKNHISYSSCCILYVQAICVTVMAAIVFQIVSC